VDSKDQETKSIRATLKENGEEIQIHGEGTGILHAFTEALSRKLKQSLKILSYEEHSLGEGAEVAAVAYLKVKLKMKSLSLA